MSELLFVYGTLKPGHGNHRRIADYVRSVRPGMVHGILMDLGAFPAMLHGDGRGKGVLLELDAGGLQITDYIEGYHPDRGQSLYLRELVDVDLGDGETVNAWTYFFARPARIENHPRLLVGEVGGIPIYAWLPSEPLVTSSSSLA